MPMKKTRAAVKRLVSVEVIAVNFVVILATRHHNFNVLSCTIPSEAVIFNYINEDVVNCGIC